ncbi:MAG: S41 family peptidase [Clostridia bacterium]|nr:S41 family peptidase [Clostridia bacterium]
MKKSSLRTIALVWAAVMIAVISSTLTMLFSGRAASTQAVEPRWVTQEEYETLQRYSRLEEVRTSLLRDYYQDLDDDALVLGAIRGMARAVDDPYTFYYTPEEMQRADENNSGAYTGIGALLQNTTDGQIQVVRVYPNTPAEAAGLRAGDWIIAVDGTAVSGEDGRSYNDAVNRIRGEADMPVTLTLYRSGQTLDITIIRGDVQIDYASYRMLPGNIGYICISQFTGNASALFDEALEAFKNQGAVGLVVDVRDNPGGLLDQVVDIADRLLPTGVIVYVKEKDGTREDYYSDEAYCDIPLAVLVNDMSASASEILASSVQAFGRGTVVGVNTYGKGIVQSLHVFEPDGAGMQVTTSSYYDALDRCPQGVGVAPDVEVALAGDSVPLEPDPQSDNQLAAAIEILQRQIQD